MFSLLINANISRTLLRMNRIVSGTKLSYCLLPVCIYFCVYGNSVVTADFLSGSSSLEDAPCPPAAPDVGSHLRPSLDPLRCLGDHFPSYPHLGP